MKTVINKNTVYYLELSNREFNNLILEKFESYCLILKENDFIQGLDVKITINFKERFIAYFHEIWNPLSASNHYDNLETSMKSIGFLTASLLYGFLLTHYDISDILLTRRRFSNILNINETWFIMFLICYSKIIFTVNKTVYFKKVVSYYDSIIEELDKEYELSLTAEFKENILKEKVIRLLEYLITHKITIPKSIFNTFTKSKQEACTILENYGLDIKILSNKGKYTLFMPQNVALALIFFFKDMKEIKLKKRLSIKEISHIFGYPRKRVYTLYCFFKYIVQKFHDTRLFKIKFYPRKFFLQDLEELLKKSYDLDYDLVFRLYTLTDLDPNTFTKEIIGHKHVNGARTLLKRLRTRSFTNTSLLRIKQNFLKLREKELISLSQLKKALSLIEKVIHIKSVSLRHGSLEYKFRYNVRNISDIKNSGLRNILSKYLHNIMKGNYPKHIFNNPNIQSGSILYLKGNRDERLSFRTIKNRLIKKLEATERMKRHTSGFLNCFAHTTQKVYNEYAQKFGIKPKHEPILSCLIRKRNIIGIEVPVWKQLTNNSYFIGHIDLLGVFEDTLIVADYKPTEKEIFKSLPQILAYAYMLKERLGFQNFDKILCVGFSKDVVWSFTPDILENETLQFIEELNSHRTIPLKSRRWKNNKISEIHTDIKKLVV